MAGLNIRPDGALDIVSLGALVHRIDPGVIPFRKASECHIHVSGGEFNVAANLSDAFNLNAGIVSAMVDYPIGDLVAERVRAMGVKPFYKRFKHNGVNGPNIAAVYSDRGHGVRAPVVFYNRAHEAASLMKPGDIDWNAIFAGGVRWFHSGGIFAALSEGTGELIIEGMKAAHKAGAVTSFDLNFREKLWNVWGGQQKAVEVIGRIVEHVDVLVGNEEDLQKGIGIEGQDVHSQSKLDPSAFFAMIDKVVAKHPNVKGVATTLREVHHTNHHTWGAVAWVDGKTYQSPTCQLNRPSCASESESTGRREDGKASGERESAFLFLEDQNQKYFPWKRAEDSREQLVAVPWFVARSARNPKLLLPAFPPSC